MFRAHRYMSAGNHPHAAFRSHRLVGVAGSLVTVDAEIYNPDGSTFRTTITHTLNPPQGVETTMFSSVFAEDAETLRTWTWQGCATRRNETWSGPFG